MTARITYPIENTRKARREHLESKEGSELLKDIKLSEKHMWHLLDGGCLAINIEYDDADCDPDVIFVSKSKR